MDRNLGRSIHQLDERLRAWGPGFRTWWDGSRRRPARWASIAARTWQARRSPCRLISATSSGSAHRFRATPTTIASSWRCPAMGEPASSGGERSAIPFPGRKFMPWVCVTGKHLFASWFDRRPSNNVGADNSLTDFYLGRMDFASFGPKVSANINMSVNADSQCSSGWPSGTRDASSATLCTIQPQAYGICTSEQRRPRRRAIACRGPSPAPAASISLAWRVTMASPSTATTTVWAVRVDTHSPRGAQPRRPLPVRPPASTRGCDPIRPISRDRPTTSGASRALPKSGGSECRPDPS